MHHLPDLASEITIRWTSEQNATGRVGLSKAVKLEILVNPSKPLNPRSIPTPRGSRSPQEPDVLKIAVQNGSGVDAEPILQYRRIYRPEIDLELVVSGRVQI